MGRRVQAQAQAQKQAEDIAISNVTESLELVRCLLKVEQKLNSNRLSDIEMFVQSIFHTAFLRGLFPDSYFKGTSMENLEGMEIRMLRPQCKQSQRLVDWVEHGVFDSIKKMYLQKLYFGISSNAEGTRLIEEYIFSFDYDATGQARMHLTSKGKTFPTNGSQNNLSSVRYQVIRLMRMLVQLCNTLDEVPEERYVFMRLAYNDSTPEDYEPPYFQAGAESEPVHFRRKPFTMAVGNLTTNYHAVSLNIKSVLDGCGVENNEQPYIEGQASIMPSNVTSQQTDPTTNLPLASKPIVEEEMPDYSHSEASVEKPRGDHGSVNPDSIFNSPDTIDEIKQYCLYRNEVDEDDAALHFCHLAESQLNSAFELLIVDGTLSKTRPHKYKVCSKVGHKSTSAKAQKPKAPKVTPATIDQDVAQAKQRGKAFVPHFDANARQQQGLHSEAGRATLISGDTRSGQPDKEALEEDDQLRDSDPNNDNFIFASQQSNGQGTKRKASFVAEPIHQKRRQIETRQRAKMSAMFKK